jgi:two-component system, NtrC family, sensor histidine kinase HydH
MIDRNEQYFRAQRDANFRRTSRMFAVLLVVQWSAAIVLSLVLSPYAWQGQASSIHVHVWAALLLGGLITSLPVLLCLRAPDATPTRYVVAVAQMLWSALLIHLTGGRIETHFHVFGSLAFLAFYRDWKVLLPATVVVAGDHLVRQMFWPESVYGIADPEWWRFLEHAFWVIFEDVVLVAACVVATREMRDIAASKVAVEDSQDAVVRSEKLAAVGQLAASVGHELRNPLAAVRNANTYVARKVNGNGDPKVVQFTELIEKELDVCGKIIADLLDFARERPLVLTPVPLRALVEEAIALVPPSTKVEIADRVPAELPIPLVDKEQFRQVLINLIQNAVEATEGRGHGRVTIDAERAERGAFRLTIEDDGPGMAAETCTKIFEPLFTTKVKGTGLGLAIVAGIVKRHQGSISVKSKVGRGTTFTIEWQAQAPRLDSTPQPGELPALGRNATTNLTAIDSRST